VAGAARDLRFDLVAATVDRTAPLEALLASLEAQTHTAFRLVVVDQNADDRVSPLLHAHPRLEVLHLRSQRGLSRARNAALPHLDADLVAFPDDDCVYRPDLLARVAARFATDDGLDGLTGRAVDADGTADPSWRDDAAVLDPSNLWNRVISFTIFLRRAVVTGVGAFDERLGLGSGTPWSSGEELDYVLRAIRSGARVVYDPAVTVTHARKRYTASELRAVGHRDEWPEAFASAAQLNRELGALPMVGGNRAWLRASWLFDRALMDEKNRVEPSVTQEPSSDDYSVFSQ